MKQPVIAKGHYSISSDKAKLDVLMVHGFLTESYWAKGRTLEQVKQSIATSVCFGLYQDSRQVGFARVITDMATFAYLCDVFILPDFQKQGLGQWLVETVLADEDLKHINRWLLLTNDAQVLYQQVGFCAHPFPERVMVRLI